MSKNIKQQLSWLFFWQGLTKNPQKNSVSHGFMMSFTIPMRYPQLLPGFEWQSVIRLGSLLKMLKSWWGLDLGGFCILICTSSILTATGMSSGKLDFNSTSRAWRFEWDRSWGMPHLPRLSVWEGYRFYSYRFYHCYYYYYYYYYCYCYCYCYYYYYLYLMEYGIKLRLWNLWNKLISETLDLYKPTNPFLNLYQILTI